MKILKDKKRAYFIGIGGIGMSALARYLLNKEIEIYGYDRTETVLTKKLEDEGMKIHYEDDVDLIPKNIDLVVYTPAIPRDLKEMNWFVDQGYQLYKRSELLKEILSEYKVIAVAGTHGKTSTSAILSHLLKDSAVSPTCFVGGIMVNYGTNFLFGVSDLMIFEADEYDRSFLRLYPDVAIINALDPDHLDIYGTGEEMVESYRQFTMQIKEGGTLIVPDHVMLLKMSNKWLNDLNNRKVDVFSYGKLGIDCKVKSITGKELLSEVCIVNELDEIRLEMTFPGEHNAMNAIGAALVANSLGLSWEKIRERLKTFKGIQRRFEMVYQSDNQVFIDDYAHHPEEIKAMVGSLRNCFPNRKITGVFQPHLYTRTRDFADGFAEELDKLDEVILMPIYPAREEQIEGVSSKMILDRMKNDKSELLEKEELIETLKNREIEVLVTLGAGDIDKEVGVIKRELFGYGGRPTADG